MMLRESGRVVGVEPDGVWVETSRRSACGQCAARAGCGQNIFSAVFGFGPPLIRAVCTGSPAAADCRVEDTVEIEIAESAVARASAFVYAVPLVLASLAAILIDGSGIFSGLGEVAAIAGFAAGLGVGFAMLGVLQRSAAYRTGFQPRVVSRTERPIVAVAAADE